MESTCRREKKRISALYLYPVVVLIQVVCGDTVTALDHDITCLLLDSNLGKSGI
jgi:hypothetical protein